MSELPSSEVVRLARHVLAAGDAWDNEMADAHAAFGHLTLASTAELIVAQADEIDRLTARLEAAEKVVEAARADHASWVADFGPLRTVISEALASYDSAVGGQP